MSPKKYAEWNTDANTRITMIVLHVYGWVLHRDHLTEVYSWRFPDGRLIDVEAIAFPPNRYISNDRIIDEMLVKDYMPVSVVDGGIRGTIRFVKDAAAGKERCAFLAARLTWEQVGLAALEALGIQ